MKAPRRLPPPNWLLAFEAAARHLSFTIAARELHVTQSAVSQQVKLLEHSLQTPLFVRHARRLELTEAGRMYLPVVQEAFRRLGDATQGLFDPQSTPQVVVKTNISFAVCCLARRLPDFFHQYPHIQLRLSHTVWLDEQGWDAVDVDIRFGPQDWPSLVVERLSHEHLFPVCAPAVAAQLHTPGDLAEQTLLVNVGHYDSWDEWFQGVHQATVRPRHWVQLDSSISAYELAASGYGVALGRSTLAAAMLAQGRLARPFSGVVSSQEGFCLVYPRERPLRPAAQLFRQWLLAAFAVGDYDGTTLTKDACSQLSNPSTKGDGVPSGK